MATPAQDRKLRDPAINPGDEPYFDAAAQGKLLVKTQTDAQSYIDLYKILLNSQTGNWNAPRTIRLGLRLNLN